MEPKNYSLIGLGVLILWFIVAPPVFDALDSMADSPSDSAWNALDDDIDLLKLLLLVFVPVVVIWLSYRRDLGGGGV